MTGSLDRIVPKRSYKNSVEKHNKGCARNILERYEGEVIALGENEFLAPGFVDAHLHAPQFKNAGNNSSHDILK